MNPEFSSHEQALYSVDFNSGLDGWSGGFADYPVGSQVDYFLEWGVAFASGTVFRTWLPSGRN